MSDNSLSPGVAADPLTAPSTRILFTRMLRGSSLYSVAMMGQRLASLVVTPIVTRGLVPAEYGVMELLDQVINVIAILLGVNLPSAMGFFFFQKEERDWRSKVIGTTLFGAALTGAAVCLLCWPWAGFLSRLVFHNDGATFYIRLMLASLPVSFAIEGLLSWIRIEDWPGTFVIASLLRVTVAGTCIALLVGILRWRVLGMLTANLITTTLVVLILGIYCFRKVRPHFEWALFFRMARFALPIGLTGIALFIINFGDRFFLAKYVSLPELGTYALAYKVGMIMSVAYSCFHTYWMSQVYVIMRRDDAPKLFGRIWTYVTLGLSLCLLGLSIGTRPLLQILAPPAYHGAAKLIPIILCAYTVRCCGDFFRSIFVVIGRPMYEGVCTSLGAVFCLGGYFLLIPRYGTRGAAVATLFTFTFIGAIVLIWTYRLIPYRLEGVRLAKIIVTLVAAMTAHALIPVAGLAAQIGWGVVLITAFPIVLWFLRFATRGEREAVQGILRQMLRFGSRRHESARRADAG